MKIPSLIFALSTVCFAQPILPVPDKTFEFHSGFWMNLDHFLREQASANPAPPAVAPAWTAALDYYRKNFIQHQQPSGDAVHLNDRLSELETAKSLSKSGLDPELVAALDAAAAVYRSRWWPVH